MLHNLENISPLPEEVISFLKEITFNKYVDRIIVFGSRAIGDYEPYSDLDLAIDSPRLPKSEWLKLKEYAVYDLRTVIRVSLVNYSTNPNNLKRRINKTGEIIYARQS